MIRKTKKSIERTISLTPEQVRLFKEGGLKLNVETSKIRSGRVFAKVREAEGAGQQKGI